MWEPDPPAGVVRHQMLAGWQMNRFENPDGFENRLAAIGLRPVRPAAECWRVERLAPPRRLCAASGSHPAHSPALAAWLDRLGEPPEPTAYRIRPAGDSD